LRISSGAYFGTWLSFIAGDLKVSTNVIGTEAIIIRITSNLGYTLDTNTFSVSVICSTPTLVSTITASNVYTVPNTAGSARFEVVDASTKSASTS